MAEKKNWIEIFLIPLVLACVGILGTHFITQQQRPRNNSVPSYRPIPAAAEAGR
jgi:hypothetical protein